MPGCALGVAAGLFLFKTLDAVLLARSLGAFVILYAIYSLWMTTRPPGSPQPVPPAILRPLASFLSGAVGTMFGAMASIFFAMVTLDSFILCAAALPAMGLGLLFGDRIHSGLSQAAFQRVVCAALFLCGVPLLVK